VDFKRIINNEEKILINLTRVREGLVGWIKTITQGLRYEASNWIVWLFISVLIIIRATGRILMQLQLGWARIDFHIFSMIYATPSNSLRRERTIYLKLSFDAANRLREKSTLF